MLPIKRVSSPSRCATSGLFVILINSALSDQAQAAAFEAAYLTPANAAVKVDARKGEIPGLKGYDFSASEAVKRFYKVDYKWIGANGSKIKKLIEDNLH